MKSPLFVVMMLLCIFISISSLYAQDVIWVKGCTHAHTKNSDGNLPPEDVANWYKNHGYNFLFITDHRVLTEPATLQHLMTESFILIGGEELDTNVGSRPVHANALGISQRLAAPSAPNVPEAIQALTDTIIEAGGLVQMNHPNWHWGIDYRDLLQADGYHMMEIANLGCSDAGDDAHISSEQIWDQILTHGKIVWGIASDDAHNYTSADAKDSFPGAGWIMVKVNSLNAENVLTAMKKGDFYSTRGPLFETLTFENNLLHAKVAVQPDRQYRIMVIGEHGQILNDFDGTEIMVNLGEPGAYDGYVRIKVTDNTGKAAWTQPVWPQK